MLDSTASTAHVDRPPVVLHRDADDDVVVVVDRQRAVVAVDRNATVRDACLKASHICPGPSRG